MATQQFAKLYHTGSNPVLTSTVSLKIKRARVVKLVDTQDLKSCSSNRVRVRFPPRAPFYYKVGNHSMKKVFLVHGFEGSPNGGFRQWLMQ